MNYILHVSVVKYGDLVQLSKLRDGAGMTNSFAHCHHQDPLPFSRSPSSRMPRKTADPEAAAESAWKYRQRHRDAVNARARLRMREKRERLKSAPSAVQLEHSARAALHRQNYLQRTKTAAPKPLPRLTPQHRPLKKLPPPGLSPQKPTRLSPQKPTRTRQLEVSQDQCIHTSATNRPLEAQPTVSKHFTVPRTGITGSNSNKRMKLIFAPRSPPPLLDHLSPPRAPDSPTPLPRKRPLRAVSPTPLSRKRPRAVSPKPLPLTEIPADSDDDSFTPRRAPPIIDDACAPSSTLWNPPLRAAASPRPLSLAEIDAADSDPDSEGGWDGDNESDSGSQSKQSSPLALMSIAQNAQTTRILASSRNAPYWGPWYLTVFGMLVRDSDRAYDQVTLTDDDEEDQSQCPVFSAVDFEMIVKYLPALPTLRSKFKCGGHDNKKVQTGTIYYILEGSEKISTDALEIGVRHRLRGDEWRAIHVADSLTTAHRLADNYRDIAYY
ncbi:hypothetical protein C8R47DRAFT_1205392 [Mycena vitilis]|nr:hypothetical protein C8R47DRAFT_1205392 [Mycena vitilis]